MQEPSRDAENVPKEPSVVNNWHSYATLADLADFVGNAKLSEVMPALQARHLIAPDADYEVRS